MRIGAATAAAIVMPRALEPCDAVCRRLPQCAFPPQVAQFPVWEVAIMIIEIQVLPRPAGTAESQYAHVESAIAVIQQSGLVYEVGALGTTVEGDPDAIWLLLRSVHEAALTSGAASVMSVMKVSEVAGDTGPGISDLTDKFRR